MYCLAELESIAKDELFCERLKRFHFIGFFPRKRGTAKMSVRGRFAIAPPFWLQ